jgi:hypothetical protein
MAHPWLHRKEKETISADDEDDKNQEGVPYKQIQTYKNSHREEHMDASHTNAYTQYKYTRKYRCV